MQAWCAALLTLGGVIVAVAPYSRAAEPVETIAFEEVADLGVDLLHARPVAIPGDGIYLIGDGAAASPSGSGSGRRNVMRFDPSSMELLVSASLPLASAAASSPVVLGTDIVVFGTLDTGWFGGITYHRGWVIHDTQTLKTTTPSRSDSWFDDGRHLAAVVTDGSVVYLFGGLGTQGAQDSIFRYDPATNSLADLGARLPSARSGAAAVWDGESSIVFGGLSPGEGWLQQILRVGADGQVEPLNSRLPEAGPVTIGWDGCRAFLIGSHADGTRGGYTAVFEPDTRHITNLLTAPPVTGGSAVWWEDAVWLFGGTVPETQQPSTKVYRISTGTPCDPLFQAETPPAGLREEGTGYFFIHGICSTGEMWNKQFDGKGKPNSGFAVWDGITNGGRLPYMAPTYGAGPQIENPVTMEAYLRTQLAAFIEGTAGYEGTTPNGQPAALGHPLEKVVIVGHSNGGLMGRWLLYDLAENHPKDAARIQRVVTLDSPDLGLNHAGAESLLGIGPFGCPFPWPDWASTHLDNMNPICRTASILDAVSGACATQNPDSKWIQQYVTPGTNWHDAPDETKVIRLKFGQCPNLVLRTPDSGTCEAGNFAVGSDMADAEGAIVLGLANKYERVSTGGLGDPFGLSQDTYELKAAPLPQGFVAKAAMAGCSESALAGKGFLGVGVRQGSQDGYELPAHSTGNGYFSSLIVATARDGLIGFYQSLDADHSVFDCSVVNAFPPGRVAGTATFLAQASTSACSALIPQTSVYEDGFALATSACDDKLTTKVSSSAPEGKIVVVNAAAEVWKEVALGNIRVSIDGAEIDQVTLEVLKQSVAAGSPVAQYTVTDALGPDAYQFLVFVPNFSEHTIEIGPAADQPFLTRIGIAVLAVAVLGIGVIGYGMGRRQGRKGP